VALILRGCVAPSSGEIADVPENVPTTVKEGTPWMDAPAHRR
jgi:hypothetical protein